MLLSTICTAFTLDMCVSYRGHYLLRDSRSGHGVIIQSVGFVTSTYSIKTLIIHCSLPARVTTACVNFMLIVLLMMRVLRASQLSLRD